MDSITAAVPDVLIQHPMRRVNYLVPGERLEAFAVSAETWTRFDPSTVTFVIPAEDSLLDEIPPTFRTPDAEPAIHIQDPAREAAYFLAPGDLDEFRLDLPPSEVAYGISFVVPVGLELIEEMPALMRGLLQTQESGSGRGLAVGAGTQTTRGL